MRSLLLLGGLVCSITTWAQDCLNYYFLQNNKTIEMAVLNKKGEQSAKQVYTVSNVNSSGSTTTADLATEMFDKKGKSIAKSNSKIKCESGIMLIDMKMSFPQQTGGPSATTEAKGDNIFIEYPSSMNVGDKLKDATMHMEMDNGGMTQIIDMEVLDRKVEGKEKITTAAGSWDCFKISFKSKMRIKTMGIGVPMNIDGVEYFAPGFGLVKSVTKNGGTEIIAIR